jgi:hypothetical protein
MLYRKRDWKWISGSEGETCYRKCVFFLNLLRFIVRKTYIVESVYLFRDFGHSFYLWSGKSDFKSHKMVEFSQSKNRCQDTDHEKSGEEPGKMKKRLKYYRRNSLNSNINERNLN